MSVDSPDTDYKLCAIAIPDDEKNDSVSGQALLGGTGGDGTFPMSFAVLAKTSLLWPNGSTIRYSFLNGTDDQKEKVNSVVHGWDPYVNITIALVVEGDAIALAVEDDVAPSDIRITFNKASGSWSYVGLQTKKIAKNEPTMNLGWIRDSKDISEDERGVILHEWGHTLGLMHEHQSPERGRQLTLDESKVYAYYMRTQGWMKATVKSQIIDVYNKMDVSNFSKLDLKSIMMYFMPAELNLQHEEVKVNNDLSDLDKAYMVINYPRSEPHPSTPEWTFDHALEIAGVDETTIQAMKDGGNPAEPTKIRSGYTTYVMSQRSLNRAADARRNSKRGKWCGTEEPPRTSVSPSDAQHGFSLGNNLWQPNTTIKYCFLEGSSAAAHVTDMRRDRVRKGLNKYEEYTSLKFEYVDASSFDFSNQADRTTCPIRISFGAAVPDTEDPEALTYGWGCMGTKALVDIHDPAVDPHKGGEKWSTVWLGPQPLDVTDMNDKYMLSIADMTIYHELGHILELGHEHESPKSPVEGRSEGLVGYMVATLFDEDSIMLYPYLPFTNVKGKETKLNTEPSFTDLYLLSLLYPDNGTADGKFAAALKAFNFEDQQSFLDRAKAALAPKANPGLLQALRISLGVDLNTRSRLAVGPSPEEPLKAPQPDAASGTSMPGFLSELMDSLKQFFNPGGNQIFTLQFPGRFLSQTEYAWDTSSAGIYGQFIKPTTVNEAEFRLVDQLYDVAPTVAGPNGTNLSIVYEQLLNNLFPKYVSNGLSQQQEKIRAWLLKDVEMTPWVQGIMTRQKARETAFSNTFAKSMGLEPETLNADPKEPEIEVFPPGDGPSFAPNPGKMFDIPSQGKVDSLTRIELSEVLTGEYLYAKQDWELARDALITKATQSDVGTPESRKALDALTRKLAHITATKQAQLASKYSDAVVRGYSHTVRDFMGYLDISSPAEALQAAKDSFRESAMSALNGAMKVYPVILTPIDWFEGLSTSFKMEDLTSDPEIIRTVIDAKSQQLDVLNSQLVTLKMGATGDATKLEAEVESAQQSLDTAQSTLAQTYSNNVIEVAKTCLDENSQVNVGLVSKKTKISQAVLAKLPEQLKNVQQAQDKLTAASRALSKLLTARALAKATDTKEQQQQIELRIKSLTQDLTELQTRWQVLTASVGGVKIVKTDTSKTALKPEEPVKLPEESSSGGSRWQTIKLTSSSESRTNRSSAEGSASSKQWSMNLWLASGSGSSSSSHGSSAAKATASQDTVDLAFRATLVTIDRGGWFQPQLFKGSKAFSKVNKDISWVDGENGVKGLLPGYPVAFLIAKDIVIRVIHATSSSEDTKGFDESSSSSSGGILCFSYSRSESASSQEAASDFQAYSNGFVVKIPGPQILGYMIQQTDGDQATIMEQTLPDDFFIPKDDDKNEKKDSTTTSPSHAPKGDSTNKNPENAPKKDSTSDKPPLSDTISTDKLRDAVSKIVEEQLNNIVSQISPDVS